MYAREIYQAAKTGGIEVEANSALKRLVEKAKKEQVPMDIIKRAIDKVNSGVDESYTSVTYELFGPGGSNVIVECLTDNLNRSISSIRAAVNKCHIKMGAMGSVSYMYDHFAVVSFKGLDAEKTMDLMIEQDLDVSDIEEEDGQVIIYSDPKDLFAIKDALLKALPNITFDLDEIVWIAKDKISLQGEDLEIFKRLLTLLDDIEDVQHVYHNVENVE